MEIRSDLKEALQKDIEELGLTEYEELIFQSLTPALRIRVQPDKQVTIGCSKFGGKPDVPPDFVYPTSADGKPQTFLAQYRLEDLARFPLAKDLPDTGMLYFFHVEFPEHGHDEWAVIYWDGDDSQLRPSKQETDYTHPQAAISFEEQLSGDFDDFRMDIDHPLFHYPHFDRFETLQQKHCICFGHQLLGKPFGLQPWLFEERERVNNLILLLQLDQEPKLEMIWAEGGMIYFFIDPADLKRRDFSKAYYEFQCL